MKRLLTEAAAIGDATARATLYSPREKGYFIYPDSDSSWVMGFANKNVFFEADGARNLDARTSFYYSYTGVTPAMAVTRPGAGSDYGIAFRMPEECVRWLQDLQAAFAAKCAGEQFLGSHGVRHPDAFDATDGPTLPLVGSQSKGFEKNADGSYDVYFAPKAPAGKDGNWVQTIPGKSWFTILRMYGPMEPWIDKTWRPSEVELVN